MEKNEITIRVHKETHEKLRKIGSMGESFDGVINRIVDSIKKPEKKLKGNARGHATNTTRTPLPNTDEQVDK